jgi:hypothetical protein
MRRGLGLLLLVAGSVLVLDDSLGKEARGSSGLDVLLLLMGSGLLLGSGEEDHP